jgi:hypothetical protein
MAETFDGFDELKRQFPSATVFAIPVLSEPWLKIGSGPGPAEFRSLEGRVNADWFEGKEPTTVWFLGFNGGSRDRIGKLLFVHRPEGWNTFFCQEANLWREACHENGQPIYQSADFAPLAELRIPDDAPILKFGGPNRELPKGDEVRLCKEAAAGARVSIGLDRYESPYGPPSMLVRVTNDGAAPIPHLTVWCATENETPQPSPEFGGQGYCVGGELGLVPERTFSGTLQPGETTQFVLSSDFLRILLSQIAALSPERYWVSVKCGFVEIGRLDGATLGEFAEQFEE